MAVARVDAADVLVIAVDVTAVADAADVAVDAKEDVLVIVMGAVDRAEGV